MWQRAKPVKLTQIKEFPEIKHTTVGGLNISYRRSGKGDVLFCMPPWPSSSLVFVPLMDALGEHVDVIAPDLPGWGGHSGKMPVLPTVTNYAQIMTDFIESFHLSDYSLLGYSFGGALCQSIVRQAKHLPKKLVFVSTIHSGDDLVRDNALAISAIKRSLKLKLPLSIFKPIVRKYMTRGRGVQKSRFYDVYAESPLFKHILEEDLLCDLRTILQAISLIEKFELLNGRELQPESLVIYADTDPGFIKKGSREIASFLEVAPVYLENVDHDHLTFDVNKSADIILNFLLA